ncbi:MAG: HNH endonuclease signature motif containing protein [Smithella sp.]
MANKARKYCQAYPCSNLAINGAYCQEHTPAAAPKETDAFYLSPAWKRFRNWYVTNHPFCEQCEREGLLIPVDVVDHIVEIKDGGARLSEENAMSLCHKCHNLKSAGERRKRKNHQVGSGNYRKFSTIVSKF